MKTNLTLLLLLAVLTGCQKQRTESEKASTQLVVFAPIDAVRITVDGQPAVTIKGKSFRSFPVGPGKHTVEVGGRSLQLELSAYDRMVVPVVADQCYAALDVSLSHYGKHARPIAPAVERRMRHSEPFMLPRGLYLSESDLPNSLKQGERALLLRSAACDALDAMEARTRGGSTAGQARRSGGGAAPAPR
jgi:hypothetical protein